jgi:hypothetical protein
MRYLNTAALGMVILAGCRLAKPTEQTEIFPAVTARATGQEQTVPPSDELPPATRPGRRAPGRGKTPLVSARPSIGREALPPLTGAGELSHDTGRVIAGEVVTHVFPIKNSLAETIAIKQDSDIQLDCGCSALLPRERHLKPGGATEITVTVRTGSLRRKKGPFTHGGRIVWTTESGSRYVTALLLRGEALPPFDAEPAQLSFSPEEVKNGAVKEIVFSGDLPIDWSRGTVECSSPCFQIVDRPNPAMGERARCRVKCISPAGIEEFHGDIVVQARARRANGEAFAVSLSVPVQARQSVDLSVSPKVVPVTFDKKGERATVKLAFRGEKATTGEIQIKAITYHNCETTWKWSPAPAKATALLEVTLLRPKKKPLNQVGELAVTDPVLVILLSDGKMIPLPAVEVGPSLDTP